jgi:hypothetical protein
MTQTASDSPGFALTQEEFDVLLLALGYATGAAMRDFNSDMACRFMRLANRVNQNNPNWKPYILPPAG